MINKGLFLITSFAFLLNAQILPAARRHGELRKYYYYYYPLSNYSASIMKYYEQGIRKTDTGIQCPVMLSS